MNEPNLNGLTPLLLERSPIKQHHEHPGVAGKPMQDSHGFFRIGPGGDSWYQAAGQSIFVAAVADGVTSEAAGANASTIAIDTLKRVMSQQSSEMPLQQRIDEAIRTANYAILEAVSQQPELRGMSTTLVMAVVEGWRLSVAHLGDSRAYLIRRDSIHQLTVDHTWVQEAVDARRLTDVQARQHTNRHTILRYLGSSQGVRIDHMIVPPGGDSAPGKRKLESSIELQPGDMILLCSDGVTEKIDAAELLQTFQRNRHRPKNAVRQLVNLAVSRREEDNITATVLVMPEEGMDGFLTQWGINTQVLMATAAVMVAASLLGMWLTSFSPGMRAASNDVASGVVATPTQVDRLSASTATFEPTLKETPSATLTATAIDTPSVTVTTSSTATASETVNAETKESLTTVRILPATPTPKATSTRWMTATPTDTRTSTVTATPLPRPTATKPPPAPTSTPEPTTGPALESVATPPAPETSSESGDINTWSVTLLEPLDGVLHGVEYFAWTPNFALTANYLYELVFWEPNEDAIANGFSPVGASSDTSVKIDLDATSRSLPRFQPGRTYRWGVLLVDALNPTQRFKLLSAPQQFVYQFGPDAAPASTTQPTLEPTVLPPEIPSPTAEPPTVTPEPPAVPPTPTECPRTDPNCENK